MIDFPRPPTLIPTSTATPLPTSTPDVCHDGLDNDQDGIFDEQDPGCDRSGGPISESDGCLNGNVNIYWGVEGSEKSVAQARDGFKIGKAIMLYEAELQNPRIESNGTMTNDGLPQIALENMTPHLAAVDSALAWRARTTDFSGTFPIILDIESWQINYDLIGNIYKVRSRARVQAQHPNWTFQQLDAQARIEWQNSAIDYITQIIQQIKVHIPGALVGWYGMTAAYRYEYGYAGIHGDLYRSRNDAVSSIFDVLDILTPEFYAHVPVGYVYPSTWVQSASDNSLFMIDALQEGARIMSLHNNIQGILPIVWHRFHDSNEEFGNSFLNSVDLDLQLFTSLRNGVMGIYIWGNETGDWLGGSFEDYYSQQMAPMVRSYCASTAPNLPSGQ